MSDQVFDQTALPREVPDPPQNQSTTEAATEEAKSVAKDAGESGKAVANTAKEEVQQVAGEAKSQAQDLYHQARSEVTAQASTQQQRAAGALRSLTGELHEMSRERQSGMAGGLVAQAADQADRVAGWLESREPGDLLEDVKRYARRNPGSFLAAAAVIGFIGGRITRNLADQGEDDGDRYAPRTRPVATVPPGAVTTQHIESVAPAYGGPVAPDALPVPPVVVPGPAGAPAPAGPVAPSVPAGTVGGPDPAVLPDDDDFPPLPLGAIRPLEPGAPGAERP